MLRTVLPIVSDPENQNNPLSNSLDAASIGSNIEQDMLLKTRATCVDAAQKLLRIIESNIYVTESLLPPPWYTVYCKLPLKFTLKYVIQTYVANGFYAL